MVYNVSMEKITTAIIGGGASGLFLANSLLSKNGKICVFERSERVGKKLSATGNGQGNLTNLCVLQEDYFSFSKNGAERAKTVIRRFDNQSLREFFRELGVLTLADERGRVYPAGKQASALTDALRYGLERKGVSLLTNAKIIELTKGSDCFVLKAETQEGEKSFQAQNVVICAGGVAAKNFGTDGLGYRLAESFGHTRTRVYPSLVQLKTDARDIKSLKGIKIMDARVTARYTENGKEQEKSVVGDLLFTDYGVSGDAIFRLSAYVSHCIERGVSLFVDFLPQILEQEVLHSIEQKRRAFPNLPQSELLGGTLNNQVGRAILKRAENNLPFAAELVKNFELRVTGSLGFDYAQVTKGGIPLDEVDETLQSKYAKNLYFAGEILDVDGPCGGFNLQWAYASAKLVAETLNGRENEKGRGQV